MNAANKDPRIRRREEKHGPVYLAIERALWVLAPILIILLAFQFPAMQAARQQAEADSAAAVAAENLEYCTKWGMPARSIEYATCVQDLANIRARAEQRLRDAVAVGF